MMYEFQPPYDPEFGPNPDFPFEIFLGPGVVSKVAEAEKLAGEQTRKLVIAQSILFIDDTTKFASEGYDILAYQLDSIVGQRVISPMIQSARRGNSSKKWLRRHKYWREIAIRQKRVFQPIALDIGGARVLSRVEDRTGIASFEAIVSQAVVHYNEAIKSVKRNNGFLIAHKPSNGHVVCITDLFFEPQISEDLKLFTMSKVARWSNKFIPDAA